MQINIFKAIEAATLEWIKIEGIEGLGQGEIKGKECILVFVSISPTKLKNIIPRTFKGFPVVIEESGIISPQ
jgi:hypothetical protein